MSKPLTIHPKYQKAAEAVLKNVLHEKSNSQLPHKKFFAHTVHGVSLFISILPNGAVEEIYHDGAQGAERAVLEKLCQMASGKPFQEISEHGILFTEHAMREAEVTSAVPGLLFYGNADPAFAAVNTLVRQTYKAYCESVNLSKSPKNFWVSPPQESWKRSSLSERKVKIQKALNDILAEAKFFDLRFEVLNISQETRVTISIQTSQMKSIAVGQALMKVEKELKIRLEPQIELILESTEDRNKRLDRTTITREVTPNISL